MIKGLQHVGIAVNNLEESVALYERILGLKPLSIKEAPCLHVKAAIFQFSNEVELELLEPMGADSPIAQFLKSRGPGIHHICFEVDDIDKELKKMAEKGVELIDKEAREGLHGKIAFLHPKSIQGVLVELVQSRS